MKIDTMSTTTGRTARLRKTFEVTKRHPETPISTYDVRCLVEGCGDESKAWDYRRNALRAGYEHALAHEEDSHA